MWFASPTLLVLLFLYIPIGLVMVLSFAVNPAAGFPLKGYTLEWYRVLGSDIGVARAVRNSVTIAFGTARATLFLAAPAAYVVARSRSWAGRVLRACILIPIVVPELLLAAGVLMLLARAGVRPSLLAILVGHVTYALPFVFFVLLAQQYGFDKGLEEAAADLGADGVRRFWYVTLPLMWPAIWGGGLLAFTISMNDFIMAFMLTGTAPTLPIFMWGLLRGAITPELNALSTLLIAGTLVIVVASLYLRRRAQPAVPP